MTDNDTLADNNIKHFGKLSSNQVSCYQYTTDVDSKYMASSSPDRVCLECGNDHSFRGNLENGITSIDMLPALFKDGNASKLQLLKLILINSIPVSLHVELIP